MTHYVCDECRSESKTAGTCQNDTCIKQGVTLKECNCEDGLHQSVLDTVKNGDDMSNEETSHKPETTLDLDSE